MSDTFLYLYVLFFLKQPVRILIEIHFIPYVMDKDHKIDGLILQIRDLNKRNSDLIDSLQREIHKCKDVENENESLMNDNDLLRKEIRNLKQEIMSRKKEINRLNRNYNTHCRRIEVQNNVVSVNSLNDLNRKNQILENLLFFIGKKFSFDGQLLLDVYELVEDPNDEFLRRLVENISEAYYGQNSNEKENKP